MLIDWIILHALTIFGYVIGIFIIIKSLVILFMMGSGSFFWIFIGTIGMENHNEIKNTFDERLKKYLIVSNRVNLVFYWLAGVTLFIYFFAQLLIL